MATETVTADNVGLGESATSANTETETVVAAVAIDKGDTIYLKDGKWHLADTDAEVSSKGVRLSLGKAAADVAFLSLKKGFVKPGFATVIGKNYFASSTAGGTENAIESGKYVTRLGMGYSLTEYYFNPESTDDVAA